MRKVLVLVTLVLIGSSCGVLAQDEASSLEMEDASSVRAFGLGVEANLAAWHGGGVSARYWFSHQLGVEGTFFYQSQEYRGEQYYDLEASLRNLYRVVDRPLGDFYTSAGFILSLYEEGLRSVDLLLSGGMEWSTAYMPEIAWNIEFGVGKTVGGGVFTNFGFGVHYYFPKTNAAESDE